MTKLEKAALVYYQAFEGDEDQPAAILLKAEEVLKEQAVLWAQAYWIDQVERHAANKNQVR